MFENNIIKLIMNDIKEDLLKIKIVMILLFQRKNALQKKY